MYLKRKVLFTKVIIILIVFCFYYFYILSPQICKLKSLKETLQIHTKKLEERKNILNQKQIIDEEYEQSNKEIKKANDKIFLSLKQEHILLICNEIFYNSNVEFDSIQFSKENKEKIKDQEIFCIKAIIPMKCTYDDLIIFLKKIRGYKKKIIIDELQIESVEDHILSSSISLNFYSLSKPVKDSFLQNEEVFKKIDLIKEDPFSSSIKTDKLQISENEESTPIIQETNPSKKILLDGFETVNTFFIGSNKNIQGKLIKDTQKNEGKYSLKVTYNFINPSRKNMANLVYENKKIYISKKGKLGISVYSFQQNNHQMGIVLKDTNGKLYHIPLTNKINWTGWKYLKYDLPTEISYPAIVERLYIQSINFDSAIEGSFLFDNLEIAYE
ncbi:hypothetical protein [Anaerophilus nitritogenes]|uniref:hypothetical protein n=1 Tax=Anaerophilus nitritogenes TaxID=2498136 RepID=UPI00101D9C2D|nr:hypothetical protein [Anaerophilus nitritogenes]